MEEVRLVAAHRSAILRFLGPTFIEDVPWLRRASMGAFMRLIPRRRR
jgi:hypothetical protein